MYNRNNFPWWLDKNFIIFILILLYYSNNNDVFKPSDKNFSTPKSPNSPEHTPNDEQLNIKINKSPESFNANIDIMKNIINSLRTSNSQENTNPQNTKTPSDANSYKTSSSSLSMNNDLVDSKYDDYITNNENTNYHTPTADSFSPSTINTNSIHSETNDCTPEHHNIYSQTNSNQIKNSNEKAPKTLLTKLPVLLSESIIQIDIEADIVLEKPALEIKQSKKDIILTQAKLLPFANNYKEITDKSHIGKLYLKGFIKNNIEYAAVNYTDTEVTFNNYDNIQAGSIVHSTIDIPFDCVTEIKYIKGVEPIVTHIDNTREVEIFRNCKLKCSEKFTPEKISQDFYEKYYEDKISYTDDFTIELEDVRVLESASEKYLCINNDSDDQKNSTSAAHTHLFNKITENLVLVINLKVLQNQQVKVELLDL